MKVTRFRKRERRVPDRAEGSLVCTISFPSIEEHFQIRTLAAPNNAVDSLRKFVTRHLQKQAANAAGASFVVSALMRASSGALRRKVLCTWRVGDDVDEAFRIAAEQWGQLDFEEDWLEYETEIEPG